MPCCADSIFCVLLSSLFSLSLSPSLSLYLSLSLSCFVFFFSFCFAFVVAFGIFHLSGEVSSFAGRDVLVDDAPDDAHRVPADRALLFSPSAICLDPLLPDHLLVCTDDVQKCIRRVSPDGWLFLSVL